MTLTKICRAAALAAALITPAAHAGVISSADLSIMSLLGVKTVAGSNTPVAISASELTVISESRTGSASANYNGVEGAGAGQGSKTSFGEGASIDVSYRCAGPDCGAIAGLYPTASPGAAAGGPENNSLDHIATATKNFSLGDMFINGSAIGGGAVGPDGKPVGGINGLTRADVAVKGGTNAGGSNATILNSSTVSTIFTATTTLTAQFALTYDVFVAAIVDALAPGESGVAAAAVGWSLSLSSTNDSSFVPLIWSPSELNIGFTATTASQSQQGGGDLISTIYSDARTLLQGKTYLLTINQSSNAVSQFATTVPEPGSLLLVGLGLFALAVVKRRQR